MAYCNWCRLDSDSDDECVWCKRPLAQNYTVYSGRDAVSLLREDEGFSTDRAVGVIGACVGIVFFAVVVYALLTYKGGRTAKTDPLNKVAATEMTWSGARSAPPTPVPTAPYLAPPAVPRAAPAAPARSAATNTGSKPAAYTSLPSVAALRDGDFGESSEGGVYIDSAKLSSVRQSNGLFTVEGSVTVTNGGGASAQKLAFFLAVNELRVPLECSSNELGSGQTKKFSVKALDVESSVAKSPEARIQVSAHISGGRVSDGLRLGG